MEDNPKNPFSPEPKNYPHLGILSFETAKTMSRLISLYKSLSDNEISRLRTDVTKFEGITYLNSKEEGFLLSLACAERLEDLDKAAIAVSRLGHKCSDFGSNRFDPFFTNLKLGIIDLEKLEYESKETAKTVDKMEKLIAATSGLYMALEALTELEITERKLKEWKDNSFMQLQNSSFDFFNQKLEHQRKQVCHFREISLWNKTFDKSVGLMARIVCIIYARISLVFSPYVPSKYTPFSEQLLPHPSPIQKTSKPNLLLMFYSRKSDVLFQENKDLGLGCAKVNAKGNMVFHAAGPSTVGGSGLALRYANVILLAEKYLDSTASIGEYVRESVYQMLPENLKSLINAKLSKNMKSAEDDALLAKGWRDAMMEIMKWLAPMAHNTVKWQLERNIEKMKFDSKPSVLLLQTLHFSDKEKTEAAIAEVLVGLSCICRFENHQ
ncbi:Protein of unknown function (DUF668) [Abeliophyllum distichum]|uniref:Uncharacterized protein n=1 Tax=Abeliophyllum distichum TaxID=126358 RepID=A0ABD1P2N5_9LAMI